MDGSCAHLVPNPVVGTEPKNADLAKRSCRCHTRYDSIYRLVDYKVGPLVAGTVPVPVTRTAYNLDAVGNWDSKTTDAVTQTRTHNAANEITQIDTQAISHDHNGNLIQDANYDYTFDENNRLIGVAQASVPVASYAYDAMGRRISKTVGPVVTVFYYDNARIIEERDGSNNVQATYTYGNYIDEVLTKDSGANIYFYHQNTLWSVHALTDAVGDVVERYTYDAYGALTVMDPLFVPLSSAPFAYFTFTGREYDAETGLYHYRARTYGAALGRFYSRDPLGYVDGMNLFQYAISNPSRWLDPTGKWTFNRPSDTWALPSHWKNCYWTEDNCSIHLRARIVGYRLFREDAEDGSTHRLKFQGCFGVEYTKKVTHPDNSVITTKFYQWVGCWLGIFIHEEKVWQPCHVMMLGADCGAVRQHEIGDSLKTIVQTVFDNNPFDPENPEAL
jgi:RHS repeat-associated protein